jgi:iron complex outermembrane receptor protein
MMDSLKTSTLLSREEKGKLEQGQPAGKIIFSLQGETASFGFVIRNTWFGKTTIVCDSKDLTRDQSFSLKLLTDISVHYTSQQRLQITAEANNVFDVYSDRIRDFRNTMQGQPMYPLEASPFEFNSGYYFMALAFQFSNR